VFLQTFQKKELEVFKKELVLFY